MAASKPVESCDGAIRAPRLAVLVGMVGIMGLVRDAWPNSVQCRINLHVAFGVLLMAMVFVQFYRHISPSREDCRQLSRVVYLLLYALFGINQLIHQPPENLRDYLAYGVVALFSIRSLAVLRRHLRAR